MVSSRILSSAAHCLLRLAKSTVRVRCSGIEGGTCGVLVVDEELAKGVHVTTSGKVFGHEGDRFCAVSEFEVCGMSYDGVLGVLGDEGERALCGG